MLFKYGRELGDKIKLSSSIFSLYKTKDSRLGAASISVLKLAEDIDINDISSFFKDDRDLGDNVKS